MEPILLDSTDEQAVDELVMSLIRSQPDDYSVLNEHREDITGEIRKLVSLKARLLKGR